MSSARKDARWAVATILVEAIGDEYEDYNYSEWQEILDIAESFLEHCTTVQVEDLANRFGGE